MDNNHNPNTENIESVLINSTPDTTEGADKKKSAPKKRSSTTKVADPRRAALDALIQKQSSIVDKIEDFKAQLALAGQELEGLSLEIQTAKSEIISHEFLEILSLGEAAGSTLKPHEALQTQAPFIEIVRLAYEGNFKELKQIFDGANKQADPSKKVSPPQRHSSNKTSVSITEETSPDDSPDEQETEATDAPTG